jgi:hypothetical protein
MPDCLVQVNQKLRKTLHWCRNPARGCGDLIAKAVSFLRCSVFHARVAIERPFARPMRVRRFVIRSWRRKLPEGCRMVETTTALSRGEVERLFPAGEVWTGRFLDFAKCCVAYKV